MALESSASGVRARQPFQPFRGALCSLHAQPHEIHERPRVPPTPHGTARSAVLGLRPARGARPQTRAQRPRGGRHGTTWRAEEAPVPLPCMTGLPLLSCYDNIECR